MFVLIEYPLRRRLDIISWVLKEQFSIYGVLIVILVNPNFIIISYDILMATTVPFEFPVFLEIVGIELALQGRESLGVYDIPVRIYVISGHNLRQSVVKSQSFLRALESVLVRK